MGSLPVLYRTTEASFAASPQAYLCADPELRQQLRSRYHDGRRLIGLAWHTRNRRTGRQRSIALKEFAPLFHLPGNHWISLQYGEPDALAAEIERAQAPLLLDAAIDQLQSIDDFAAQIAALDLVVTIDNTTAHLAGALGIPTLLLLPFAANWRWMQSGDSSPWYPSLRLLRQERAGDWTTVIEQAAAALALKGGSIWT